MYKKLTDKPSTSYPIAATLGQGVVKGLVGLEIEMEGRRLIYAGDGLPTGWTFHDDGSLRGAEHAEYVLAKPVERAEVPKLLDGLFSALSKNKATFDDSNRTSVHVHLNVQDFHLNRLSALMGLYFIFEEVLTAYCGTYRVGNLFCQRIKDASEVLAETINFVKSDMNHGFSDGVHYSGLNPSSIPRRGSLEFRTLRGTSDPKLILMWVEMLLRLYDKSAQYTDPRDLISEFSLKTPNAFFREVFGDFSDELLRGTNWTTTELGRSLHEGMRHAQDLCYCRNWSLFRAEKANTDAFGRVKKRKVAVPVAPGALGFVETVTIATPPAPPEWMDEE